MTVEGKKRGRIGRKKVREDRRKERRKEERED